MQVYGVYCSGRAMRLVYTSVDLPLPGMHTNGPSVCSVQCPCLTLHQSPKTRCRSAHASAQVNGSRVWLVCRTRPRARDAAGGEIESTGLQRITLPRGSVCVLGKAWRSCADVCIERQPALRFFKNVDDKVPHVATAMTMIVSSPCLISFLIVMVTVVSSGPELPQCGVVGTVFSYK